MLAKFENFEREIELRNSLASEYNKNLQDLKNNGDITLPFIEEFNKSVYAQYSILVENRDKLIDFLKSKGIPTAVHYPKPLHLQEAFSYLNYEEGDFPIAESVSKRIISLPLCPYKNEEEIEFICNSVKEFFS